MNDIKRKRLANTSEEQYEEYLSVIENDYVFRSGIINPTLGDDYINKKWEELANKLNSLGNGPILSTDVWKKRFNDWKNATRSKHRRIQEHSYKTGGGPKAVIKLTLTEERGINVWGKVTVIGTCKVLATGGLAGSSKDDDNISADININNSEVHTATSLPDVDASILTPILTLNQEQCPESPSEHQQSPVAHRTIFKKVTPLKRKTSFQRQNKPLNEVAQSLVNVYADNLKVSIDLNNNLKRLGDLYQQCEDKKLKLENRRLEFEIAKFKFENSAFEFN